MPYTEQQKMQHITELQRYLHFIDMKKGKLPAVIPDGIYGERTKSAISDFQREHGLSATGETDTLTWDMVVKEYFNAVGEMPEPLSVFPSADYICKAGCSGMIVSVIQLILLDLSKSYDNLKKIDVNGEFTPETVLAVKMFQEISGLTSTGEVDSATWNLLLATSGHKI